MNERLVSKLRDDERVYDGLKALVDYQKDHEDDESWIQYDHTGISSSDVNVAGWILSQLSDFGIIEKVYNSNSTTNWRVNDIEEADKHLKLAEPADEEETDESNEASMEIEELFEDVVGREKPRKWIKRSIKNQPDASVHHLMIGPPGTGKSTIMDDILNLPDTTLVVGSGSQSTAAGITNTLVEQKPDILLVEELEKMSKADAESLLTLMGNGYIKLSKHSNNRKVELDTLVIASANQESKLSPDSLLDRFMVWRFDKYSYEEFEEVCVETLDVDDELAQEIAAQIHSKLGSTSPREADRVASLASNKEEVSELVEAIRS